MRLISLKKQLNISRVFKIRFVGNYFLLISFLSILCLNPIISSIAHAAKPSYPIRNSTLQGRYYAANSAQKANTDLVIRDITFKVVKGKKEIVYIHSNRYFSPSVLFALEDENPKLIIEVNNIIDFKKDNSSIPVSGELIKQIQPRYDKEHKVLTVILDLYGAKKHTITQAFNKAGNIYVIEIEEKEKATAIDAIQTKEGKLPPTGTEVAQITSLIKSWRRAWESKKINDYMSHYHSDFKSNGKDFIAWKQYKENLNARYLRIIVKFSNPGIKVEGSNARAYFRQSYHADSHHYEGYKIIELKKDKDSWKIFREQCFAEKPAAWPL